MTRSEGASNERAWTTALGLALGPAVAIGLARFAYGLLLPGMRSDLSWSFAQAGAMNTANAIGYLLGALVAAPLVVRIGVRRAFTVSLVLTAVALLGCAPFDAFVVLLVLRLVAGVTGAVTFVVGATLAAQVAGGGSHSRAAVVLGVYFAGGGLGVAISGLVIPPLLAGTGAGGWRWGWVALAALAFAATAAAVPAAHRVSLPARRSSGASRAWRPGPIGVTMGAYALFGAGYIAYVTFIVAFLEGEGAAAGEISAFWIVLGLAAVGSSFAWGPVLGRLRGGRGIALALGAVAIGALLPLLSDAGAATFGSAVLFGG
ncbi:MAG: YbfB/YjiJ family MFS transporter, partial [Nocardioidaceae bacterium]